MYYPQYTVTYLLCVCLVLKYFIVDDIQKWAFITKHAKYTQVDTFAYLYIVSCNV